MKKVAILLADGFETIEALTVVDIMRRAEIKCSTFSLDNQVVRSSHNIDVVADKNITDKEINEYDVLVLPGGMPGAKNLRDNSTVIELIKKFNSDNKLICSICAGPISLGKAGVLENKEVTCYPGFEKELGICNYSEDNIVEYQNIITARGPAVAFDFAFRILEKIDATKVTSLKKGMLFI